MNNDEIKTRQIERLQYENCVNEEKNEETLIKIDSIEQKQYENDVQLVGLPEPNGDENDTELVLKLAHNKMGQKIKESEVEEIIRLGRKSETKPRDVIIRFKNKTTRDNFYNNRKKTVLSKNIEENIYVNDRLTNRRKGIFYACRKLFKAKKVAATWTQHGNILVRKTTDDQAKEIQSYKDLEEFNFKQRGNQSTSDDNITLGDTVSITIHITDYDFSEPNYDTDV